MRQAWLIALVVGLAGGNAAWAQTAWQYKWQKGQVLTYKAEHVTAVTEVVDGGKTISTSKLHLTKRWQVTDVDAKGIATLQLSITEMRQEQKRPNGETLLFDSANLDKSTPELKEQMAKFIGQTLAVIRMDVQGRVVEVKQGTANRFESEPPFVVLLPTIAPKANQSWLRNYKMTLDPPHGTGEKFDAAQKFTVEKVQSGQATLTLTTELKTKPEAAKDQVPLLQKMPQGSIVFDFEAGRLARANLQVDRTLENHQGPGSSYRFQSTYAEQWIAGE